MKLMKILRSKAKEILMKQIGKDNSEICDYLSYPKDGAWCLAGVIWFFETKLGIKLPHEYSNSRFTVSDWCKKDNKVNEEFWSAEVLDIIQMEWNPENNNTPQDDGADHVGIVIENDGENITLVEFNHGENANRYNKIGTRTVPINWPCLRHVINMESFFTDNPNEAGPEQEQPEKSNADELAKKYSELIAENNELRKKIKNAKDDLA